MKKTVIFIVLLCGLFFSMSAIAQEENLDLSLTISNIEITNISSSEATLTWETSMPCVSRVAYGKKFDLSQELALDSDHAITTHRVVLTALDADTEYFFKVVTDVATGQSESDTMRFKTLFSTDNDAVALSAAPEKFQISSPYAGSYVSENLTLQLKGSELSLLERIEWFVDDELMGETGADIFEYEIDTTLLENGAHTLCASGYDTNGEKFSNCVSVLVKNGRAGASFRFAVIGDTRTGDSVHQNVVNELKNLTPRPVMIFNTGDLTASGSTSEWQRWQRINQPLGIDWNVNPPQYIGAYGNHDGGSASWKKYLVGQQRYGDGKSFFVGYGNALFLVLNSQNNTSKKWIEDTLRVEAPKYDWIFAFWHHPPYPFGAKSMDSSYRDFCPTLQKYGAKMIFVGHAHYYTRTFPMLMDGSQNPKRDDDNGIIQVVAGGAGAPLYSLNKNVPYKQLLAKGVESYHYCVVDINNNILDMTVKNQSGRVIDTLRLNLTAGDTPPAVSILTPQNNQTVEGNQKITVRATDDLGISRVDFFVDDQFQKSVTRLPYEINWDTTSATNGLHIIRAVAFDTTNQNTTAEIRVRVGENNNPGSETIAEDNLEAFGWEGGNGWSGPWTKTGDVQKITQNPYKGERYARLRTGRARLERVVDLSNATRPVLRFAGRIRSFEGRDQAIVKVSSDGITYTDAMVFTSEHNNNLYQEYAIDLSPYPLTDRFRVAFSAEMSDAQDFWYIDEISITDGNPNPNPNPNSGSDGGSCFINTLMN